MNKKAIKVILSIICIGVFVYMLSSCVKEPERQMEYLAVQFSDDGRWSIIDQDGNMVAENAYPADAVIGSIHNGVYWVQFKGRYWLYSVNHPGKPVVDEGFYEVADFVESDRAAVFCRNAPFRIINTKGETVVTLPKNIKSVYQFNKDGYAMYQDCDGQHGVINRDGQVTVKASYKPFSCIADGVFMAIREYDDPFELLIDTKGNQIGKISHEYNILSSKIAEGKIVIQDKNPAVAELKVLNSRGKKIFTINNVAAWQRTSSDYFDGYLTVTCENDSCGVVDAQGKMVLLTPYRCLVNLGHGEFFAQKGEKWGVVNVKGEIIIDFKYDGSPSRPLGNNFVMRKGNDYVLVNRDGKEILCFSQYGERNNLAAFDEPGVIYETESFPPSDFSEDETKGPVLTATQPFTLSDGKLGPIQVGQRISNIPATYAGLYDKYTHKKEMVGGEGGDEWEEEYYKFTMDGKEVFRANIDDEKNVICITLMEGSSSIVKTQEGYYVGYPARTLYTKKPMEWETYFESTAFATSGHYTYHVNIDDLIDNEYPTSVNSIEPNAKICMIVYHEWTE